MSPKSVAFVLGPVDAHALSQMPKGTPLWIVSTPEMASSVALAKNTGLPVTELFPNGTSPDQWFLHHLDTVDQHHNDFSQSPGYTQLLVLGLALTSSLQEFASQFGFQVFRSAALGFVASKHSPPSHSGVAGEA